MVLHGHIGVRDHHTRRPGPTVQRRAPGDGRRRGGSRERPYGGGHCWHCCVDLCWLPGILRHPRRPTHAREQARGDCIIREGIGPIEGRGTAFFSGCLFQHHFAALRC